jgi:hypothetical protein
MRPKFEQTSIGSSVCLSNMSTAHCPNWSVVCGVPSRIANEDER